MYSIAKIYDGTHQTPNYQDLGIKFVSVENINDLYASSKYISEFDFKKDFRTYPKKDDILMTRIGDIGTPAIVKTNELLAYYVSLALLKIQKNCTPTYLYYYIQTPYFQKELWHRTIHVAFPKKINKEEIGKCLVKHPNNGEQVKLSTFLAFIEDRISIQNKIISQYETLIKGIIDFALNRKGTQYLFKELYLRASEGGTPPTDNKEYYENGNIPFIKIEDLSSKYINKNLDYITAQGLNKSSAWLIPENSVIYSNGATIGRISINMYPVATKQGILGIVPSKIIKTEYLYYYMCSTYFRKQIKRITVCGTMDCAYLKDINTINCYIPSLTVQEHIIHALSKLDKKLYIEKQCLSKLKEQKKYLLAKMFI